jgi:hypothetical protein
MFGVSQHKSKRKKPDSKSIPCILLANLEHGNYRAYGLATKKVYVSRHIVFSETKFPACILTKTSRADYTESQSDYSDSGISLGTGTHSSSGDDSEANSEFEGDEEVSADCEQDQVDEEDQVDECCALLRITLVWAAEHEEDQDEVDHENQDGAGECADDECAAQRSPSIGIPDEKARHRYPSRERKQPSSFWANTATRAICHIIDYRNVLNNLRSLQQCHTSQPVDIDIPSLKVALKSQNSDQWEAAIHEELESLREAQTWDEVEASVIK